MVDADAHGHTVFFALFHQRRKALIHALQLGVVFGIGVFFDFEFLFVGVVAGVDTHLFNDLRGHQRGIGSIVNVGHQRYMHPGLPQPLFNLAQIFRLFDGRRGQPHDFAAGLGQLDHFSHRRLGVHGIGDGHGLDADGIAAADAHIPHHDFVRLASAVLKQVFTVTFYHLYKQIFMFEVFGLCCISGCLDF